MLGTCPFLNNNDAAELFQNVINILQKMLNDFFENNGTKRISRIDTFFVKDIFPFFLGFISLVITVVSLILNEYLLLILYSPFILGIAVAMFMAYKMKI